MSFMVNKYLVCSVPVSLWRLIMIDVGSGAAASCYSLAGRYFHACKQLVLLSSTCLKSLQEFVFETLCLKSVLCKLSVKMPLGLIILLFCTTDCWSADIADVCVHVNALTILAKNVIKSQKRIS